MIEHIEVSQNKILSTFVNSEICIHIENQKSRNAEIRISKTRDCVILRCHWGEGVLKATRDEIFVFLDRPKGHMLLVFFFDGLGFCIDEKGHQWALQWS